MNNIDIQDIVTLVNEKLKAGSSVSSIEKEMKLGKDTLRKRLNRAGYRFSKEDKCFLLKDNTDNKDTSLNIKTYTNTSNIKESHLEYKSNSNVTQVVNEPKCNSNVTQTKTKSIPVKESENKEKTPSANQSFTENQFKTLVKIIEEYELKEKSKTIEYEKENVISRSFRSYKKVLDDFSNYCKEKNLIQKDALADALILFMKINN